MVDVSYDVDVDGDHLATFTGENEQLVEKVRSLETVTEVLTNYGFAVDVTVDEHGDIFLTITNRGDD